MIVAVVGLGKLGAPLSAVLASKGHEVIGIDVNPEPVRLLNEGRAPVDEPGLEELVLRSRDRLSATTDFTAAALAQVTILLVPTPSDDRGVFRNEFLLAAVDEIGAGLRASDRYHVVVVGSTVMPGVCDAEVGPALERASGRQLGEALGLCYGPEFIALGNVIRDMLEPDLVLIGEVDRRSGDVLEELYSVVHKNDPPLRRMSLLNAELAKIAVNTYVTMKISYANALADLCERLPGADVDVVTDALGLDTRIGSKYLRGAIAYGGPCFPRDNKAFTVLARDHGAEPLLAEATDLVNIAQTARLARIVSSRLEAGMVVGILGLAYKPQTGVIDESPGVALARILGEEAGFEVIVFDPEALEAGLEALGSCVRGTESAAELAEKSDVIVITTPWPEFAELPIETFEREGAPRVVVDCWRLLEEEKYGEVIEIVRPGRTERAALSYVREQEG